jgi:hypothetical protein
MKMFFAALVIAACLFASGVSEFHTVYVLPMPNNLDQFLAIKLTRGGVMQVVTDPQKADVVMTDRIGAAFEDKLDELYGAKTAAGDNSTSQHHSMQPISRGKGAIFIVDRKTRAVVWSTYEHAKNSSAEEMNHVAERIAATLDKDRKGGQ